MPSTDDSSSGGFGGSGTAADDGRITTDEDLLQGGVSWRSYLLYFLARGIALTMLSAVAYSVFAVVMVSAFLLFGALCHTFSSFHAIAM